MAHTNKQEIEPGMLLVCAQKGLVTAWVLRNTNNGGAETKGK